MRSTIKSWGQWATATAIGAIEGVTGIDRDKSILIRHLKEELAQEKARHAYPARYAPILGALQARAEYDPETVLARAWGKDWPAPLTVSGMADALRAGDPGAVQWAEDAICVAVRMIMRPGPSPVSPDGVFAPEGWEWRNDDKDEAGDRLCLYAPGKSGLDYHAAAYLDGSWTAYGQPETGEAFACLDMGPRAPTDPAFRRQAQIDAVKALRRAGVFT